MPASLIYEFEKHIEQFPMGDFHTQQLIIRLIQQIQIFRCYVAVQLGAKPETQQIQGKEQIAPELLKPDELQKYAEHLAQQNRRQSETRQTASAEVIARARKQIEQRKNKERTSGA